MERGVGKTGPRAALLDKALYALLAVAALTVAATGTAAQQKALARRQEQQGISKRLGLRLRSFVPDARGSIYFEPTTAGGRVRLTVLGLPPPQEVMPQGAAYVVWAVAPGEPPVRVGELQVDQDGNGGLEFERPASFERYSVVVTAETSAAAPSPLGVMALATRAGAISAFFGQAGNLSKSQLKRLSTEMGKRLTARRRAPDFFAEVDDALSANGG
ncbi:MAG TPA: hypothetical protein VF507_02435, partial [Pyrinomonadaceae bacterium]